MVFEHNFCLPSHPAFVIFKFGKDWKAANSGSDMVKRTVPSFSSWVPPLEGWVKLNTDGSYKSGNSAIAAGGIFRDFKKNWLGGYALNKGTGCILEAELWGICKGLKFGLQAGYSKTIVETDSLDIVNLLSKDTNHNHPSFSLIQNCKIYLAADWCCSVTHVYRERNFVADRLAKLGHSLELGDSYFEDSPSQILQLVDDDMQGLVHARHGTLECPAS
ncbi:hypothetical protein ACOSP7_010412 [Xanthoceras sorbifolium]